MRPSKTQAQKKAEHAEKAAALAALREAEKRERDEYMRRQAMEAAALKAAQQDKKKNKKSAAVASAPSPLLPSATEVANTSGPGEEHKEREAGGADHEPDAELAQAAAAHLSTLAVSPSTPASARLVLNHSTHIDGLMPFMTKLQKSPLVKTILPGAISHHAGHSHAPHLSVVFQSDATDGAWNYVAKHGCSRQDLRITPKLKIVKRAMVDEAIEAILNPTASSSSAASSSSSAQLLAPNSNRLVAEMAAQAQRTKDQARHAAIKDKQQAAVHAKKVADKAKRLKAAIGQKNESVQAYAEEWVKWEK